MAAPTHAKTVLPILFVIGLGASVAVLFSVRGALPQEQSRASQLSAIEAQITLLNRDLDEARRAHRDEEVRAGELQLAHLKLALEHARQRR